MMFMNKKGVEIQFLLILIFLLIVAVVVLSIIFVGREEMFNKLGVIGDLLRFGG